MKFNGTVEKTNVNFYELINVLGGFAVKAVIEAKIFAMGLVEKKKRKKIVTFENLLLNACEKLQKGEITSFQFLTKLTTAKHDNPLVNESWGLNFSRIDLIPESEAFDDEDEDSGVPPSSGSEYVNSDEESDDSSM